MTQAITWWSPEGQRSALLVWHEPLDPEGLLPYGDINLYQPRYSKPNAALVVIEADGLHLVKVFEPRAEPTLFQGKPYPEGKALAHYRRIARERGATQEALQAIRGEWQPPKRRAGTPRALSRSARIRQAIDTAAGTPLSPDALAERLNCPRKDVLTAVSIMRKRGLAAMYDKTTGMIVST